MTDKIEKLIERLRTQGVWSTGLPPYMAIEAAEALSALRAQRDEVVEECARVAEGYEEGLSAPGAVGRSHPSDAYEVGVADCSAAVATAIRNLKSQDEQGCSATSPIA